MKKIYKARKGATFSNEKAKIYGKCIYKIVKHKGSVKPIDVVEEARDKASLLHDYFDWNNNTAAEKHRLQQARMLLNSLVIEVVVKKGKKPIEQKAYFNVNTSSNKKESNRVYVSYDKVLSRPELRRQILENALDEINYWQKQYKQYRELKLIFTAIKRTKRKLKG